MIENKKEITTKETVSTAEDPLSSRTKKEKIIAVTQALLSLQREQQSS